MRFRTLLGSKRIASRAGLLRLLIAVTVAGAVFGVYRVTTQALAGPATMSISPANTFKLYYNQTPFTETVNLADASNVGAVQYRLTWNPAKLQWVSSDMATVTSGWLQSTGRGALCEQTYDATATGTPANTATFTATPTGTLTATPTITSSPTGTLPPATNTPTKTATPLPPTLTPTPTGTRSPTPTITPTPTPAGNVSFGCVTLGTPGQAGSPPGPDAGDTPVPLAHFTFKSVATAETSDQLKLSNVGVTNTLSTPTTVVTVNAVVALVGCHDMDGDGKITILDIAVVAAHFGASIAVPLPPGWTWVPKYDVDNDGHITILDLARIAAAFGFTC
jgi:Dockerin type I domain